MQARDVRVWVRGAPAAAWGCSEAEAALALLQRAPVVGAVAAYGNMNKIKMNIL